MDPVTTEPMEEVDDLPLETSDEPYDAKEDEITCYLAQLPEIFSVVRNIVRPDQFRAEHRKVVDFLQRFYNQHNRLPSRKMVYGETGVLLDKVTPEDIAGVEQYVLDMIESFCKVRETELFLYSAADRLQQKGTHNGLIRQLQIEMEQVSKIAISRDLGYEIHRDLEGLLSRAEKQDGRPTGFKLLDEVLDGGPALPSVNIIAGASGHGKSILLQNIAVNLIQMGHDVVYYTLELRAEIMAKRFASMMVDRDIREIFPNKAAVSSLVLNRSSKEGKLFLKELPMGTTCMNDIEVHFDQLQQSHHDPIQYVIIDYMGEMRPNDPSVKSDNIGIWDGAITQDIVRFSQNPKALKSIWTASQYKKGEEEQKTTSQGRLSGGKGKVDKVDNVMNIKRTPEDIAEERIWLHLTKTRTSGATGVAVPLRWDRYTLRITDWRDRSLFEEENPTWTAQHTRRSPQQTNARQTRPPATAAPSVRQVTTAQILKNIGNRASYDTGDQTDE